MSQITAAETEKKKEHFFITFLMALIAAGIEIWVVLLNIEQVIGGFYTLLIHLGITCVLLVMIMIFHKSGADVKLLAVTTVLTAFMSIFGAVASMVMLIFYAFFIRQGVSFLEWLASLFPEDEVDATVTLFQRLSSGWDDFSDKKRILTFQDAIKLGTVQQKREALAKISQYYRREFAPALMAALHDESNSIRVQAATVIAKFDQEYMSRYMELSRRHNARPEDKELLLELAQQADAYAYSGILTGEREDEYRLIAIEAFEKFMTMDPGSDVARFALARLYIYNQEPEKSYNQLISYLKSDEKIPIGKIMWLIESMFYLEKYDEIRDLIGLYEQEITSDYRIPLIIKNILWTWKDGIPVDYLVLKNEA